MTFYLGVHEPHWAALPGFDVPLFVSAVRLRKYGARHRFRGRWALDSGGFSELAAHGRFTVAPERYAREIEYWSWRLGPPDWAAPQDWMCEPEMLAKTGLTVAEHQRRTIDSVVTLRRLVAECPVIPVLQGYHPDEYEAHADAYTAAGFDLAAEQRVGVGSVCRRQAMGQAAEIMARLRRRGIFTHGFGFKLDGLRRCGRLMGSADSMAWSAGHRKRGCPHGRRTGSNCPDCALAWRHRVVAAALAPRPTAAPGPDDR